MCLIIVLRILISITLTLHLCLSPIILGAYIFTLAIWVCLMLALCASSWLSLFIFLMYVGGLLIIFFYFAALAPNQYFYLKETAAITLILFFLLVLMKGETFFIGGTYNFNIKNIFYLLNYNNLAILLFAIVVLFLILVAAVKNRGGLGSPLRPFN